jgi:TPR repeat protein
MRPTSVCYEQYTHLPWSCTFSLYAVGYVPDGMSPDQYKKLKEKEELNAKKKNFAAFGPQSFRSRSLQSWHKDMEKGEAGHLMVCEIP